MNPTGAPRAQPIRAINPADPLLGMVQVENALSNRLLRDAGIDPDDVRRVLLNAES